MQISHILLLSALLLSTISYASEENRKQASKELKQIVLDFNNAIEFKNQLKLETLLYNDLMPWYELSPSTRTNKLPTGLGINTPKGYFFSRIFDSQDQYKQTISKLKIQTDGDIGSAFFHYVLLKNGKKDSEGSHSFQFAKTFSGWKINAITSSNETPANSLKNIDIEKAKHSVAKVVEKSEKALINQDVEAMFSTLLHPYVLHLPVDSHKRKGLAYNKNGITPFDAVGMWKWGVVPKVKSFKIKANKQVIMTDGEIASVYKYGYQFIGDDIVENWGDSVSDYVRTADGWKMTSLVFSTTDPSSEK